MPNIIGLKLKESLVYLLRYQAFVLYYTNITQYDQFWSIYIREKVLSYIQFYVMACPFQSQEKFRKFGQVWTILNKFGPVWKSVWTSSVNMPSPSRKSKKDLTLPPGSLTLTLIGMSKSWDSRKHLMRRVYKSNQILNEGTCLSCCERFGGNTLQCKWCNHLYVSLLKSIFVNAKIYLFYLN